MPKSEIVENGYDLSINKYKKVEYQAVEYEPTEVILGKIDALEAEIQQELGALKELLKQDK